MNDIIILNNVGYEVLLFEKDYVFHPEYFGITPVWVNDPGFKYQCTFILNEYQLILKSFIVSCGRSYPQINGIEPQPYYSVDGNETVQYMDIMEPLNYTGAILTACQKVNDYGFRDNIPCFCYKHVKELIFNEGKLITTVEHNKDMLRIRKNIDLGLRRLDKNQDMNCIKRFLKASLVGEYCNPEKSNKNKARKYFHDSCHNTLKKTFRMLKLKK